MSDLVVRVALESVQVSVLVLVMMVGVDLVNLWTRGRVGPFLMRGKHWRQYVLASAVGAIPGCAGAFTNVSLYMHGMISFGALAGAMAAVSGDEAFVMLAMFPRTAVILIGILLVLGILIGWMTDQLVRRWHIRTCHDCGTELIHRNAEGAAHYLKEHVWRHIIKRHLWKTVLWTFFALMAIEFGMQYWDLQVFVSEHTLTMLFLVALVGLIPESGPHLIVVTMYASGLIPFSILLTSSIVQDGHGMLPMLAYSVKDSLKIKGFNLGFGLMIGLVVNLLGW
ncbi:MAG: arsenic efflux protein [Ignavibacteriales bacterium]|nr:arsenic efflux protein [Ignavibacteriales bacterium]